MADTRRSEKAFPINYRETGKDLLKRIDIHEKYGASNIDQWTVDLLKPQAGMKILDIGCGTGKQCYLFDIYTAGKCEIVGCDVSEELLNKAREKQSSKQKNIRFQSLDFNTAFPFENNSFDMVTSAFAIYYASNLEKTFKEVHRVLKSGRKFFVSGPLPENKKIFYDIILKATGKPIPPMPGSSRFKTDVFRTIKQIFGNVQLNVFENPLTFPEASPFMDYVRASLSEDRKLWQNLFNNHDEYEATIRKIEKTANEFHARDGKIIMTKVVGGIIATKT